tara:strand:+ start:309 stop:428 length:120 start_codon:yes stop_codon:yes gene_type:complete
MAAGIVAMLAVSSTVPSGVPKSLAPGRRSVKRQQNAACG